MKLATLKDGTRDGQLAVVARDLKTAHIADGIAPTLQAALDDWAFIAPQLAALYEELNAGRARRPFDFDPGRCMAPLPRAYQFVVGEAYGARSDDEPRMIQCGSDDLLGPTDDIVVAHEEWGIDFGAGVAVVTGDVAMGATPDDAHQQIRLLMLANEVSLRNLIPPELARPATSFSPVAVTPDELGDAWRDARAHLLLRTSWNGHLVGQLESGVDMAFNFAQLIAHLARTRNVRAGSIVGSGIVLNGEAVRGYACIAEQRRREILEHGEAVTQFMRFGDMVRIETLDANGASVMGAIEQKVERLKR
ncbi:fumarylacetoacetate hydrolase [Massilia sp. JS1662]|nr:fumarylacetoacetate hydrolase family protein [Massilia sp. JS1662]KGF81369.1 fumarylacetoacetate hydrolase [Massilia sp. JS1662]